MITNINELYNSGRCELLEVMITGKKRTPGVLRFRGIATALGDGKEIRALESGVVLEAGWNSDIRSRQHKRGVIVTVSGRDGVHVSYERLSHRVVNVGDYVRAGDVIGYEGCTGAGKEAYLMLRFTKRGRLIDGCEYLGIEAKSAEFKPMKAGIQHMVSRVFGFTDTERVQIDTLPESSEIWRKLYERAI